MIGPSLPEACPHGSGRALLGPKATPAALPIRRNMVFDATPTNMTEILVVALAVVALIMLMRKRYDSNLPLLFYFFAVLFTNAFDRPVNPFVMYGSLAFALLLRFEFMN